jgi:sporulation protein YlmC with PRC-barrel domain
MKVAILTLLASSASSTLLAQGIDVQAGPVQVQVGQTDAQAGARATASDALRTGSVRGSELLGLNVENRAGDSVGEINDIVMNVENGRAAYAAISVGGFLGIGDKLFAIPYDAIAIEPTDSDADATNDAGGNVADDLGDFVAILDVNPDSFDNANGFDQDNWPNMADDSWRTSNDAPFENARTSRYNNPSFAERRQAYEQELEADRGRLANFATFRLSQLTDAEVNSAGGEELGDVEDVVLNVNTGKIEYFAVEHDDRYYALPLSAVQVQRNGDDLVLTSTVSASSMRSMKSFDDSNWPATLRGRRTGGVNVNVR